MNHFIFYLLAKLISHVKPFKKFYRRNSILFTLVWAGIMGGSMYLSEINVAQEFSLAYWLIGGLVAVGLLGTILSLIQIIFDLSDWMTERDKLRQEEESRKDNGIVAEPYSRKRD